MIVQFSEISSTLRCDNQKIVPLKERLYGVGIPRIFDSAFNEWWSVYILLELGAICLNPFPSPCSVLRCISEQANVFALLRIEGSEFTLLLTNLVLNISSLPVELFVSLVQSACLRFNFSKSMLLNSL